MVRHFAVCNNLERPVGHFDFVDGNLRTGVLGVARSRYTRAFSRHEMPPRARIIARSECDASARYSSYRASRSRSVGPRNLEDEAVIIVITGPPCSVK